MCGACGAAHPHSRLTGLDVRAGDDVDEDLRLRGLVPCLDHLNELFTRTGRPTKPGSGRVVTPPSWSTYRRERLFEAEETSSRTGPPMGGAMPQAFHAMLPFIP